MLMKPAIGVVSTLTSIAHNLGLIATLALSLHYDWLPSTPLTHILATLISVVHAFFAIADFYTMLSLCHKRGVSLRVSRFYQTRPWLHLVISWPAIYLTHCFVNELIGLAKIIVFLYLADLLLLASIVNAVCLRHNSGCKVDNVKHSLQNLEANSQSLIAQTNGYNHQLAQNT